MSWLEGAEIRPSGDEAFVVEYGDAIDPEAGRKVAALAAAFDRATPPGLVEVVPTFRSVLVLFDPETTSQDELLAALPPPEDAAGESVATRWSVPACLEGAAAEDLDEAAAALGLAPGVLRERFLGSDCTVGMYGFAPGFAYLSGLDPTLAIPRRGSPRRPMPPGSIIIAGGMAALCSVSMPTGWYVVGRTAVTLFRPDETPMVAFAVGDVLTFHAVTADELAALAADPDGGARRIDP